MRTSFHDQQDGPWLLDQLMKLHGLNSNSLARSVRNVTKQPTIYKFLHRQAVEPQRATLKPLADFFNVPLDAFYEPDLAQQVWERVQSKSVQGERPATADAIPGGSASELMIGQLGARLLSWETMQLMPIASLPIRFSVVMPDDSCAPTTPKGMHLTFDRSSIPSPGDGVIVQDAEGRRYVRRLTQATGGGWRARPLNDSYAEISSEETGAVLVAGLLMRIDSKI